MNHHNSKHLSWKQNFASRFFDNKLFPYFVACFEGMVMLIIWRLRQTQRRSLRKIMKHSCFKFAWPPIFFSHFQVILEQNKTQQLDSFRPNLREILIYFIPTWPYISLTMFQEVMEESYASNAPSSLYVLFKPKKSERKVWAPRRQAVLYALL